MKSRRPNSPKTKGTKHKLSTNPRELDRLPAGKEYDGGGLYLDKHTAEHCGTWRYDYRLNGRTATYTIGSRDLYDIVRARELHVDAQLLVAQGISPGQQRKRQVTETAIAENSSGEQAVKVWAERWHAHNAERGQWRASHAGKVWESIENDVAAAPFWLRPIKELRRVQIADLIKPIVKRAPSMAQKVLRRVTSICAFAVMHEAIEHNPAHGLAPLVARPKHKRPGKQPAILDLSALGDLLVRAEAAPMDWQTYAAHMLIAYTTMRAGEVVGARWPEFNLDRGEWIIPRARMKNSHATERGAHRVPLSPTLVAFLRGLPRPGGPQSFVCHKPTNACGHTSTGAVEKFYRENLGLRDTHVPHGWRSSLETLAGDEHVTLPTGETIKRFEADAISALHDHDLPHEMRKIYDRGEKAQARAHILNWWMQQLDGAIDHARGQSNVRSISTAKRRRA